MIGDKMIKVCGMRCGENIASVEALGVDMIGLIFYPRSPRYVVSLPSRLPQRSARVGVFVDPSLEEVASHIELFGLDYVQLHGGESPQFCEAVAALGVKLIKAFSVGDGFDFEVTKPYGALCELFVFDTATRGYGGSGRQFDWSQLERYGGSTPFLLSGGVAPQSVEQLKGFGHPRLVGYDLNSCFEQSPALKDITLLTNFLEELK